MRHTRTHTQCFPFPSLHIKVLNFSITGKPYLPTGMVRTVGAVRSTAVSEQATTTMEESLNEELSINTYNSATVTFSGCDGNLLQCPCIVVFTQN